MFQPGLERPKKRAVQVEMDDHIIDMCKVEPKLQKGNVLVVAGPEPDKAIESLRNRGIGEIYTLVELDKKNYNIAVNNLVDNNLYHGKGISIINDDFYEVSKDDNYTGFDFDFCNVFTDKDVDKIFNVLKQMKQPFWFRITSALRNIPKEDLRKRQLSLLTKLEDYGFNVIDFKYRPYRDKKCMAMDTFQAACA